MASIGYQRKTNAVYSGQDGWRRLVVLAGCLVLATILRAVEPAQKSGPLVDETGIQEDFSNRVRAWLNAGNFDELDRVAADLRRTNEVWTSGLAKLDSYYRAMYRPVPEQQGTWDTHLAFLEHWAQVRSNSVAARVALGQAYANYAWFARGQGWSSGVSSDSWKLYATRLAKARQILEEAEKLPVKDAWLYVPLVQVANGQSWPRPQAEELVRKALAIDPRCYSVCFNLAIYLLPRWHGRPGDWARFAEDMADLTRKEQGESVYARIVWATVLGFRGNGEFALNDDLFPRNQISYARLKQGFEDLNRRFPGSMRNVNGFCWFACAGNDRETAHQLFTRIGEGWDPAVWQTRTAFDKWRAWADPRTPRSVIEPRETLKFGQCVTQIAFAPDGQTLAVGAGRVTLYDLAAKQARAILPFADGRDKYLAYSPDGKRLAVLAANPWRPSNQGNVTIWETSTGKQLTELKGHRDPIRSLTFTRDGRTLITGGGQYRTPGEILFWDMTTFQSQPQNVPLESDAFTVTLAPNGRLLAFTQGHCVAVWDLKKQSFIEGSFHFPGHQRSAHDAPCDTLAFSPDSHLLVSGDSEGILKVWDPTTGEPADLLLNGHQGTVTSACFSPDGKILATAGWDEVVRLWDVATGQQRAMLVGHRDYVITVAFPPDGKTLASGSRDGTVKLWDLAETLNPAPTAPAPRGDAPARKP